MYLKLPPELENSQLEIIIDLDDPDRQVQAEVKRVGCCCDFVGVNFVVL